MSVRKHDHNMYHLSGPSASVVIAPAQDVIHGDEKTLSAVKASAPAGTNEWVAWGKDDNEPNQVLALNWESPSKPSLMDQAKEFILGAGVAPFRETYEDGKVVYKREAFPEIKAWYEENEIFDKYLELAALSMTFSEQAFVNLSIGEGNDIGLQTIQPLKCRYAKPTGPLLDKILISPQFGTGKKPTQLTAVPIFNRKDPTRYAESIIHLKKAQIGQDFYNLGLFWGTKWWTKVANKIPLYHLNGLENGYNIKYLIEIDEEYFILDGETAGDEETDKKIEARKDKFMGKIDEFLAGVENADKAIVMIGQLTTGDGKANDLIRIKSVDNKMTDEAYTKVFQSAQTAQAQGHGLLPVLAGIAEGDKLGGSGSELEHAAMYQVAYRTPSYRRHLIKPLNLALKLMNLDDGGTVGFRFVDIEFTTLDKNPTGKQNSLGA